ncbi:3-(3-hydroxy-phenyl)propionate/3-hydroxycinnamic acid hydroxylase [Jannaschia seosinensis]|uniref:3-(3-hydroxy-phenyl)propionate/3-hydroxycinnamic acid hydroxylase n=1 Tax=Jannaschia seosinensis TaxID=313367 RepID=A0A0M7BCB8_9RHOB|nr:FAD-dependent monooxygenase [Jannaschia seosinensis]CUH40447.1 3-(3-hydroxy-phenyl)propionate/3-hydroxycinnamic acid hydroxylase [Jannaschia seosinensis]
MPDGDRYPLAHRLYPYARSADQDRDAGGPAHHPVIVVGGGPVGLALALDLGLRGTPTLVLDDAEGIGEGSRALCFSKRTLEIADRLGCGAPMVEKGVKWQVGKVFHDTDLLYEFDLLPEAGHKAPAFVNLPQPDAERFLVERIRTAISDGAPIEIRGRNRVTALETSQPARLQVETPDGPYALTADYVVACDGARSPVRKMLDLDFEGRVFEDNFLIADVRMKAEFPTERWFWFAPHFKSGDSALLHKQPDDVWRIDFQLGWDIDRKAELSEDRVRARVDAMLGEGVDYDLVWTSIYTFQCRRMRKFRHGPVLFAGDAAHQVSPFGARGANSGIQDADNLGWKLDLVVRGAAPDSLLDTYAEEREAAADENILASTRSTDFITPKSKASRMFRDATLALAARHPFARAMVNSGRLSMPSIYDSYLSMPDALPDGPPATRPGAPCPDAPLGDGFLLEKLGSKFTLLAIGCAAPETGLAVVACEPTPELTARYLGAAPSALYLIRPDQHVAARWPMADAATVAAAHSHACGATT